MGENEVFKSYRSYWNFAREVRTKSRYFWGENVHQFLAALKASLADREEILTSDRAVWRAQLGCEWTAIFDGEGNEVDEEPEPYKNERMKPLHYEATEGRCNPKGIPVLYATNTRDTAVAEVRPWVGAQVSVAQLRINKELRLVDCSRNHGKRNTKLFFKEPPPEECLKAAWTDIDNDFARPITENDRSADYVPTQILAEFFKENGFDGILFKSSVADGHNLVLFDPDGVEIVHRQVVEIKKVSYESKWSGGARFKDLDAQ